jgi:8-oxo-dGTP pyrophosphatase MutT (NUDIX family)
MKITESAGGVVLNAAGQVLVVNQHGNSWSFPKGHLEPGEDALAAAIREIREESGVTELTLLKPLGFYERHRIGAGGVGEDENEMKRIHMFLFLSSQEKLHPEDPDHPEARWVTFEAAEHLLTHPKDRAFFASLKDSV